MLPWTRFVSFPPTARAAKVWVITPYAGDILFGGFPATKKEPSHGLTGCPMAGMRDTRFWGLAAGESMLNIFRHHVNTIFFHVQKCPSQIPD
jgi:hypothetical protein